MSAARTRGPSSHGRLHKRGNSASSVGSPLSPLSADSTTFMYQRSETPMVTYEESWTEPTRPAPPTNPIKIKPYLRKLSSKDNNTLDLSRPAAEQTEGLTGLGISEYGTSRSAADVNFSRMDGRSRHHRRSTSNTSQFSTSSSLQRPTAPYMPFIRQTPRPYTPPISQSSPPSVMGSENEADDIMSDEEFRLRQNMFDPARRSGSISSVPGVTPPLRIHTSGSSTRLGGSYSQTSLPLTSPNVGTRPRGDTLKSFDTTSPSSRTSFDQTFRFIRGGRDSPVDPASRVASIAAARQAFEEKEAAKERRAEKEASKKEEKDTRKRYKQQERVRRKSEADEAKRARTISNENMQSRPSIGGREYTNHREAHTRSLPARVATTEGEKSRHLAPQVTTKRAAKGRWLAFITWFKTRILRLSRRMHLTS